MHKFRLHRGWFILGITLLNTFACLGLGRFSLGVLLPFMKDGLALNYTELGFISSAVFLGYLVGALSVGYFMGRFSTKKVLLTAMFTVVLGMLMSVFSFNFWTAYLPLLIIGLGAGTAYVASLSVVGRWFSAEYRGMALGISNSGSGFGMMVSGTVIPLLMLIHIEGWRLSWAVLAFIALAITLLNLFYLVERPELVQLKAYQGTSKEGITEEIAISELSASKVSTGEAIGDKRVALQVNRKVKHQTVKLQIDNIYTNLYILIIGFIYFTFGFSYLIFSTFFVDYLISDAKIEPTVAGQFFAIAGFASIFSGFIWGSLSDKLGRMLALFYIYVLQASLLILFVVTRSPALLLVETILYALTLWAIPTVIVAAVSDLTPVTKAPLAIGYMTIFFGIGQWIAPIISGSLIDQYASYSVAYYISAGISFLGALSCLGLHWRFKVRAGKADVDSTIE